jgi:hypothetical protein
MMFVDGENLSMPYGAIVGDQLRREEIAEKFPCNVEPLHSRVATG